MYLGSKHCSIYTLRVDPTVFTCKSTVIEARCFRYVDEQQ